MTAIERQFLIKAFEVEEHLRPKASPDKAIPLLRWRTIGVLCDLTGEQADELVHRLAATDQVRIMNREKRLIMLSAGRDVARNEIEAQRRRFWDRVTWVSVPLTVIAYWLTHRF